MRLTVERSMPAFSASAVWLSPRTARAPRRKGLGRRWAEYRCGIASFFGMDALDRAESEALSNGSVSAQTYASRVRAEVTAVVIDELFPAEVKRVGPKWYGKPHGPAWKDVGAVRASNDPRSTARELARKYVHRDYGGRHLEAVT